MLTTAKNCPADHSVFQSDLDNLYAWSQQNLMEFKVKKCKLMHITKRKTPIPSDLHLNNRDLKKDDHDGSENVAKKMNLFPFKPATRLLSNLIASKCRRLFLELNSQGFYSSSKRGRKIRRRMSTSSIKRQIRRFHVVVVQWTSKKCTKKRDALAELLFWSLNLLFFLSCRRRRRSSSSSCLSSLIIS